MLLFKTSLSLLLPVLFLTHASQELTYIVKEEIENGTVIGNILADSGLQEFVFDGTDVGIQLYEDQITGLFEVERRSGLIIVASRIDREAICPQRGGVSTTISTSSHNAALLESHQSQCQVDFIVHIPPEYWINVNVLIEDINDHSPHFHSTDVTQLEGREVISPYIVYISEGVSVGYEVPLNGATDEDVGTNGIQTYSLGGGDIESETLALKYVLPYELYLVVKRKLDFEQKTSYRGQLKACDGGKPVPKCTHQNITIFVTDVNDNEPRFERDAYHVRISESTPVMSIIMALVATDIDSGDFGKITYRFGQIYNQKVLNFFAINEKTGEVWIKCPLDAREISHAKIQVIASDSGNIPKTGSALLQIDIEDVNDHPPWIEVKPINSPLIEKKNLDGNMQLWIEENQPIGTQIGIILTGDKDTGANGEVNCVLKSRDSLFWLRYSSSGRERKMYSLQSKVQFDLEAISSRSPLFLLIECTDAGNPRLVTRQNIQVNIVDVNEHPAFFNKDQSNLVVHLQEDAKPGMPVILLKATDRDATPRMRFELLEGHKSPFRVDPTTGMVYTVGSLDREEISEMRFSVRVLDIDPVSIKTLSGEYKTANVTVIIDDVNDNSPMLQGNREFSVPENRPAYTELVGRLSASDPDRGENGTIRFLCSNAYFKIDPISGEIHAKLILDRENVSRYQVQVEITDTGRPVPRKTLEIITINVEDVNDNRPIWKLPQKADHHVFVKALSNVVFADSKLPDLSGMFISYFVNASLRSSSQYNIVRLVASDADQGPNAEITFRILRVSHFRDESFDLSANNVLSLTHKPKVIKGREHFYIDSLTNTLRAAHNVGTMRLNSGLFELIIRASDNGDPPLHSDAILFVYYGRPPGLMAGLFGMWNRSLYIILLGTLSLFVCTIICPVIICLVRSCRKTPEYDGRRIIACVEGDRCKQENSCLGQTEELCWTKEQMNLPHTPCIDAFEVAEDLSASLVRCGVEREAVIYCQSPRDQYQRGPSSIQYSDYAAFLAMNGNEAKQVPCTYNDTSYFSNTPETRSFCLNDYPLRPTRSETKTMQTNRDAITHSSLSNRAPTVEMIHYVNSSDTTASNHYPISN